MFGLSVRGERARGGSASGGGGRGGVPVPVTRPGNPVMVKTPGITGIILRADTTHIELPDGSTITGQASFIMGGVKRTAANVSLASEAIGAPVTPESKGDQANLERATT